MRIFKSYKDGDVWTWGEDILYIFLLVFTLGFAFEDYRREISREFNWSILGGLTMLLIVNAIFFIPMLLLSPISIPAHVIYMHRRQTKDAKKLMIKTLKE